MDRFLRLDREGKCEGVLKIGYALDILLAINIVEKYGEDALQHLPAHIKWDPIIQAITGI